MWLYTVSLYNIFKTLKTRCTQRLSENTKTLFPNNLLPLLTLFSICLIILFISISKVIYSRADPEGSNASIFILSKTCLHLYVKGIGQLKLLTSAFIKIHKTTAIIWATIKLNTTKEYWKKFIIHIIECMYINASTETNLMTHYADKIINYIY